MRRIVAMSVVMLVPLFMIAPASAAIKITRIRFNPAGADTGTDRHLNKEVIVISKVGGPKRSLKGWVIHDRGRDHTFRFPDITLAGGDYVYLHTGKGEHTVATGCNGHCVDTHFLHWGLESYVWNNDGDRAILRNASSDFVDGCAYTASADSPKAC